MKKNENPRVCEATPPSLLSVADQIGKLVSHSGFDPLLGRIWTILLLNPAPLNAKEIGKALKVAPKKVEAAMAEMERWGSVGTDRSCAGEPRWSPELNPLKMMVRVLRERETAGMEDLSRRIKGARGDAGVPAFAQERLRLLEEILRVAHVIVDIVLMVAQLDASALKRVRDTVSTLTHGLGGVLGRLRGFRD